MGLVELGVDYCRYNSDKPNTEHIELIWEYYKAQISLLLSALSQKHNTGT